MEDNFLVLFVTPIILFILTFLFKNKTPKKDPAIQIEKEKIKELKDEIENQKETVEKIEKEIGEKVKEIDEVKTDNLTKKEDRDKKAGKFFPGL